MKMARERTLGRYYNLVRPLVGKFLTQLKAEFPQGSATPLLCTHLRYVSLLAAVTSKAVCPSLLTIVLFTTVKITNLPACSSADE